jgi:flagellar biogenesis protein FliO
MRRTLAGSVMAMTLAVTCPALADGAEPVPTPSAAVAPAPPPAASPASAASPAAPRAAAPSVPAAPAAPSAPAAPAATTAPVAHAASPASPALAAAPPAAVPSAASPGLAAAAPAAPPAVAPVKDVEPPLALRPAKPLTLAEAPAPTPWPYKTLFGVAVVAAGALVWKKRRALAAKHAPGTPVRVLGKTSMGLRGELALVEVAGMRLLVGVTPSSMQTLAVLPDDFADEASETDPEPMRAARRDSGVTATQRGAEKSDSASRARSLFTSLDIGPPIPPRVAPSTFAASRYADERDIENAPESGSPPNGEGRDPERRRRPPRDVPLEGQARGIALALRNRK